MTEVTVKLVLRNKLVISTQWKSVLLISELSKV